MARPELRRHVTGAAAQDGANIPTVTQKITAGIAAGPERKRVVAETVVVPEVSGRGAAPAEAPAMLMKTPTPLMKTLITSGTKLGDFVDIV
jgi:hypothetical protein